MKYLIFLLSVLSVSATVQPTPQVLSDTLSFPPTGGFYAFSDSNIGTNIIWVNYRLIYTPFPFSPTAQFVTNFNGQVSLKAIKIVTKSDLPPLTTWSILKECGTNFYGTCPKLPGNSGCVAVERYDIIR